MHGVDGRSGMYRAQMCVLKEERRRGGRRRFIEAKIVCVWCMHIYGGDDDDDDEGSVRVLLQEFCRQALTDSWLVFSDALPRPFCAVASTANHPRSHFARTSRVYNIIIYSLAVACPTRLSLYTVAHLPSCPECFPPRSVFYIIRLRVT